MSHLNFNSNFNNYIKNNNYITLRCTGTPNIVDKEGTSTDSKSTPPSALSASLSELIETTEPIEETPEEKYKREKLAEIAERKAEEVFVTRTTGKYECQACGYIYDESVGNEKKGIAPGTPFNEIEKFRCPQCGANKKYFVADVETLSGFKDNLKYGFGGNAMTGGQKQNLIFGGLFLGFLLFMSGYLLE